jgi:hypothetical protein
MDMTFLLEMWTLILQWPNKCSLTNGLIAIAEEIEYMTLM